MNPFDMQLSHTVHNERIQEASRRSMQEDRPSRIRAVVSALPNVGKAVAAMTGSFKVENHSSAVSTTRLG
jgi:Mrp family chromosome partitioning ATPase